MEETKLNAHLKPCVNVTGWRGVEYWEVINQKVKYSAKWNVNYWPWSNGYMTSGQGRDAPIDEYFEQSMMEIHL